MLPLKKEQIKINHHVETPQEAIEAAGKLLVETDSVTKQYVDSMIKSYEDLGSYIVLAPHIAIPHSRPESGVNEQCLALLRLSTPIPFGHPTNDDVALVIPIGGVDENFHIKMLQSLSNILTDKSKLDILMNSNDVDLIYKTMTE
ncbi:MAG: PTS sugar transporter subunit IIA [Mammaliicoccus vitulinus]